MSTTLSIPPTAASNSLYISDLLWSSTIIISEILGSYKTCSKDRRVHSERLKVVITSDMVLPSFIKRYRAVGRWLSKHSTREGENYPACRSAIILNLNVVDFHISNA